jgi:hypothetical protein
VYERRALRRIFRSERQKEALNGDDYIMRNFLVCIPQKIK